MGGPGLAGRLRRASARSAHREQALQIALPQGGARLSRRCERSCTRARSSASISGPPRARIAKVRELLDEEPPRFARLRRGRARCSGLHQIDGLALREPGMLRERAGRQRPDPVVHRFQSSSPSSGSSRLRLFRGLRGGPGDVVAGRWRGGGGPCATRRPEGGGEGRGGRAHRRRAKRGDERTRFTRIEATLLQAFLLCYVPAHSRHGPRPLGTGGRLRDGLERRGYLEVETPVAVPFAGAGAAPAARSRPRSSQMLRCPRTACRARAGCTCTPAPETR